MIKVLFVTALDPELEVDLRQPSLGVGYLMSMIRQHRAGRYEFRHAYREIPNVLDTYRPALLAISSTSPCYGRACEYARSAAARGIPVIIGGIHISMLPESLSPEMDVAVLGEGEQTLLRLLDLFEETSRFPRDRLRGIPGIAFREEDGSLVRTEPVEHIDPLDGIPFPDRTFWPVHRHAHLFTSRGCPYRCSFCASTHYWPGKVRFFSAEYVAAEIEGLIEQHGVSVISFYDDLFCANLKRCMEIASLLDRRGLIGRAKFTCNARSNLVTDELARVLKAMGVASVNLGLESGCQTTLEFLKDRVTLEQNRRAIDILRRHGFFVSGSFVIGSPHETEEQIMETYRFLKASPLAITDIYILIPYPGTPVWDYALGRGLVGLDMDWSRLTYAAGVYPKRILNLSEHVSSERLCALYRKFQRVRLRKILSNIPWHPYRVDLLHMAARMAAGKVRGAARRVRRAIAGPGAAADGHEIPRP